MLRYCATQFSPNNFSPELINSHEYILINIYELSSSVMVTFITKDWAQNSRWWTFGKKKDTSLAHFKLKTLFF